MVQHKLSRISAQKLKEFNKRLYPARLEWRADNNNYRIQYTIAGKRSRKKLSDDIDVAYRMALEIRRRIFFDIPVVSDISMKLGAWFDEWRAGHWPGLAITTRVGYDYQWAAVADDLKQMELKDLSESLINDSLAKIEKKSQREHAAVLLSGCLKAAVKVGHLSKSPHSAGYKKEKRVVHMLAPEAVERLVAAASITSRPLLSLAGHCALRRGEIFGLRVGDIDLEQGHIYIRRSRTFFNGALASEYDSREIVKSTKTGEPRVVPIPPVVSVRLAPLLAGRASGEWIFEKIRGDLPKRVRAACNRLGITPITFHDLRHVAISNIVMVGGLAAGQALAGHKQVSTTADIYSHLTSNHLASMMGTPKKVGLGRLERRELEHLIFELSDHKEKIVQRLVILSESLSLVAPE